MIEEPYGPLLSPVEAEEWLDIPSSTVRTWHQRRRVTGLYAEGLDHVGRPRFFLADLLVLKYGKRIRDEEHGPRTYTLAAIVGPPCPARAEMSGVVERSCDRVA